MLIFPGRNYINFYGGAEVLILNLVRELTLRGNTVGIIGNPENELVKILNTDKTDFQFFNFNRKKITIKETDILVVFRFTKDLLYIQNNPKIIQWSINSNDLIIPNKLSKSNLTKRFIAPVFKYISGQLYKKMMLKKSLVFMDQSNHNEVTSYYSIRINPVYIPIPIVDFGFRNETKYTVSKEIKISYLGRSDEDWKIYPLLKVLDDLENQTIFQKIKLFIITNSETGFKKHIREVSERIEIVYILNKRGGNLQQFLSENSQLHFSMGTSALEGGICKIPTILLDYSFAPFPKDYKYKWLFESKGFSLGSNLLYSHETGSHTLINILITLKQKNTYLESAYKCYRYCVDHHSIKKTVDKLLDQKPEMRLKSFQKHHFAYWKLILKNKFLHDTT